MATITVNVDDDVYETFRKLAAEEKNGKKGFLGATITDAMKRYAEENKRKAAAGRLLDRIRKGYNLRAWKKGFDRDALYDRR